MATNYMTHLTLPGDVEREIVDKFAREELEKKTNKTQIDFDGANFRIGAKVLNYKELHDIHIENPDFAFIVYGDRAYLLSYVQDDANAMREMRFQSVIAVTGSDNTSNVKASGIYVKSSDGINFAGAPTIVDINSENKAYKATEINSGNKDSDVWYPSNKAIVDYVDDTIGYYVRSELFNKTDSSQVQTIYLTDGSGAVSSNGSAQSVVVPIVGGQTYTIHCPVSSRKRVGTFDHTPLAVGDVPTEKINTINTAGDLTITAGPDDVCLVFQPRIANDTAGIDEVLAATSITGPMAYTLNAIKDKLDDLHNAIENITKDTEDTEEETEIYHPDVDWDVGFIGATSPGMNSSSQTNRIYTKNFIFMTAGSSLVINNTADKTFKFRVASYKYPVATRDSFLGSHVNGFETASVSPYVFESDCYIRVTLALTNDGQISKEEGENHVVFNVVTPRLSEEDVNIDPDMFVTGYDVDGVFHSQNQETRYVSTMFAVNRFAFIQCPDYGARIAVFGNDNESSYIYSAPSTGFDTSGIMINEPCYVRITIQNDNFDAKQSVIQGLSIKSYIEIQEDPVPTISEAAILIRANKESIDSLQDAIYGKTLFPHVGWVNGAYSVLESREYGTAANRLTTTNYVYCKAGSVISLDDYINYKFRVTEHTQPYYVARNAGQTNTFIKAPYTVKNDGYVRVTLSKNNDATISLDESKHVHWNITTDSAYDDGKMLSVFRRDCIFHPVTFHLDYLPNGDDYALFDYNNTSLADYMSAWDSLIADSNGWMRKSSITGKDATDTYDLVAIETTTDGYVYDGGVTPYKPPLHKKPKIIIVSNVHGTERPAPFAIYYLFRDIVHKWKSDPVLEYMRMNLDFVIIPTVNPYGFDNRTLKNGRGVNINRNFSSGFVVEGDASDYNFGGTVADSEAETLYVKRIIDAHSDAVFVMDLHSPQGAGLLGDNTTDKPVLQYMHMVRQNVGNVPMINTDVLALAENIISVSKMSYPDDYSFNGLDDSHVFVQDPQGQSYAYALERYHMWGNAVEVPGNLPGETTMYSNKCGQANTRSYARWIINMIAMIARYN